MRHRRLIVALAAVAALAVATVLVTRHPPRPDGRPRVSALLVLEGDWQPYGQAYERGVRLAVAALHDKGVNVDLYRPQSYSGDKEVALQRVRELNESGGVKVLVGLMSSSAVEHCAPWMQQHGMFLVDGAATRTDLSRFPFFLRTIPPDDAAAQAVASWVREAGGKRGVISSFRDEWSAGLRANYEQACRDKHLELIPAIELDRSDRSGAAMRAVADQVAVAKPDFVLLAILGEDAAVLMRLLPPPGQRPAVYAVDNVIGEYTKLADATGAGVRFVVERRSEPSAEFQSRFQAAYPGQKPHLYTQTAYDATLAACTALRTVGDDPQQLRAWLLANPVPDGANGPVRFDASGNPATQVLERREFAWADGKLQDRPAP
jgi:ABC-type branched-subunit amino acid transport system substrate-binding protein